MRSSWSLYEPISLTLVTCLHGGDFPPIVLTDGITLSSIHLNYMRWLHRKCHLKSILWKNVMDNLVKRICRPDLLPQESLTITITFGHFYSWWLFIFIFFLIMVLIFGKGSGLDYFATVLCKSACNWYHCWTLEKVVISSHIVNSRQEREKLLLQENVNFHEWCSSFLAWLLSYSHLVQ